MDHSIGNNMVYFDLGGQEFDARVDFEIEIVLPDTIRISAAISEVTDGSEGGSVECTDEIRKKIAEILKRHLERGNPNE